MKIIHLTSIPTIPKLDVSSKHIALDAYISETDYIGALAVKRARGEPVYMLLSDKSIDPMSFKNDGFICHKPYGMFTPAAHGSTAVVHTLNDYIRASEDPLVDTIAIEAMYHKFWRPRFILELITSGRFYETKEHWLYGIPYPAELGVYTTHLTRFLSSKFTYAVGASCFIYSVYGARFSSYYGALERFPWIEYGTPYLGMSESMMGYDMNKEQIRTFYMNDEVVQSFAEGRGDSEYNEKLCDIMEGAKNETQSVL